MVNMNSAILCNHLFTGTKVEPDFLYMYLNGRQISSLKVVISGKYKNLNKITKI